jgi:hypothetical protein
MRGAIGPIAVVVAAGAAVATSNADGIPVHRSCGPRHALVLSYGTLGRAFKTRGNPDLQACLYGSRHVRDLAGPDYFPRPAVDMSGTLVGFAIVAGDGAEPANPSIEIEDLAKPLGKGRLLDLPVFDVKVGSLRLKANGSIAWIQCPVPPNSSVDGSERPNCVSAGRSKNSVYKRDTLTEQGFDRLDSGRQIDPSSLQLHGSRLTWIDAGSPRSAMLH